MFAREIAWPDSSPACPRRSPSCSARGRPGASTCRFSPASVRTPSSSGSGTVGRRCFARTGSIARVCRRGDPAVILYISGSTGPPKGVQIAANFLAAVHPWMVYGVDLEPADIFWPTGDPGWGYGLICYMLALAMGVPVTCHEAAPLPEYALQHLSEGGVTNLATTPTLLRGIFALPTDMLRRWPVQLRVASSCGEPLNGEVVTFFQRHWGVTVMDHYGSSEFGLPVGNCNGLEMEVRPGSMGLPLPGHTMAIVDDDGREAPVDTVGQIDL